MNKLLTYTKRVLTTVLTMAMVLTSLPAQTVYAGDEPDDPIVVTLSGSNVGFDESKFDNIVEVEEGVYEIDDPEDPIKFGLSPDPHYQIDEVTYGDDVYTPTEGIYTIPAPADGFTEGVEITVTTSAITHSLTVAIDDNYTDDISFEPGAGIVVSGNSYTVDEVTDYYYSVTVSNAAYYTPLVKVNEEKVFATSHEDNEDGTTTYFFWNSQEYNDDEQAITISATRVTKEVAVTDNTDENGSFTAGTGMTLKSAATETEPAVYTVYQADGYSF